MRSVFPSRPSIHNCYRVAFIRYCLGTINQALAKRRECGRDCVRDCARPFLHGRPWRISATGGYPRFINSPVLRVLTIQFDIIGTQRAAHLRRESFENSTRMAPTLTHAPGAVNIPTPRRFHLPKTTLDTTRHHGLKNVQLEKHVKAMCTIRISVTLTQSQLVLTSSL